jgi:hypothetical protein
MIVQLDNNRRLDLGKPNDDGEFVFNRANVHALHELMAYAKTMPSKEITTLDGRRAHVEMGGTEYTERSVKVRITFHWITPMPLPGVML